MTDAVLAWHSAPCRRHADEHLGDKHADTLAACSCPCHLPLPRRSPAQLDPFLVAGVLRRTAEAVRLGHTARAEFLLSALLPDAAARETALALARAVLVDVATAITNEVR